MSKHSILLATLSFVALSTSLQAETVNYGGAYIGANIGYSAGKTQMTTGSLGGGNWGTVASNSLKADDISIKGATGGLHGGYGHMVLPQLYLGLDATAALEGVDGKQNQSRVINNSVTFNTSSKKKDSFGLAARIGTPIDRFLVYAKLGVVSSNFEHSAQTTSTVSPAVAADNAIVKESKSLTAFAPGLGFETMLTKNIMAGGEYTYLQYGKHSMTLNNQAGSGTMPISFQPRENVFKVRLSYKFP